MEKANGEDLPQAVHDGMAIAGDMAIAQCEEARVLVMETLGIGSAHIEFPRMVLDAMQILATNYLATTIEKTK